VALAAIQRAWQALRGRRGPGEGSPNLVFLFSDEHNARVLGAYGSPLARTPHLDGLAERGVVFESAYCASPLCGPSRLSLTAGKYASRVGAWGNRSWLPGDDVPSIARVMRAAGYDAVLCGKQHYDATRRYGFREITDLRSNRYHKTGIVNRRDPDDLRPPPELAKRFSNFRVGKDSPVLRHDRTVAASAVDFLRKRGRGEAPFFLLVGFLAPHFPLIVPEPYWMPYQGRVPAPEIPDGQLASLPRNYQHLRLGFRMTDVPPDVVQRGRELYHGLVTWLDEQVGTVLDALARSRFADDSVVVYAADHGENLGEHGLWWKNCMYEHAARVPLVVSWPARWAGGQRRSGACSLLDLVQTFADLGGAATPDDWDGDSLLPWLDDPQHAWKDRAAAEYFGHNVASGFAMLRRGRWKYVYHTRPSPRHEPERELYDLTADPGEFSNRAGRPEHAALVAELHAALVAELGEDPDEAEARCRAVISEGYGRPEPES
jgi:choline-sulfatase